MSQLVGPDCRRFLLLFGPILSDPASKITEAGHSKAEADDFVQRHTAVLEPLVIVGHLSRAVRMLSADEISELKLACARFGAAWRAGIRDLLTVKGHVVEEHVSEFVDLFGTCGILGEDGLKACIRKLRWSGESFAVCAIPKHVTEHVRDISKPWFNVLVVRGGR